MIFQKITKIRCLKPDSKLQNLSECFSFIFGSLRDFRRKHQIWPQKGQNLGNLKYLIRDLILKQKKEQDGRLAPAYLSPEYKYFDQHLQTVKNETTV